jgi:hypothetical protein
MSNKSNEITLAQAVEWTTLWREKNSTNCKAFLIPAQDLTAVLKEMGILTLENGVYILDEEKLPNAGVRAYMAIDTNVKEGNGEKILVVGTEVVDGNHKDIINKNSDVEMGGSGVYDFSEPCPTTCDLNSPLNSNP